MLRLIKARMRRLTLQVRASHKLEDLVDEDDGEGELQHHDPLLRVQVRQLEDHLRDGRKNQERQKQPVKELTAFLSKNASSSAKWTHPARPNNDLS